MTWLSTSCRKIREASNGIAPTPDQPGIQVKNWFYASAKRLQPKRVERDFKNILADALAPNADQEVNDILLQNPQISGATLVNVLKSKGLRISKHLEALRKSMEADSSSAFPLALTAQPVGSQAPESFHRKRVNMLKKHMAQVDKKTVIKPKKESAKTSAKLQEKEIRSISTVVREAISDDGVGPTKFDVVLITEGMGNFNDAHYYSREAIESGITIFTGTKIYADHPTREEDEIRPERSVRDVIGHYENLRVEESDDGCAQLCATLSILPDKPFEWARALMLRAIENAKKFPDKPFVGLSINANGEAEEKSLDEIMRSAPEGARVKLSKARENGVESVKVVTSFTIAVSCDLVTEAGAGGKFLNFIEGE